MRDHEETIGLGRNTLDKFEITGGKRLTGEVTISGAKNAAVAIIPAAILSDGICRIENVPEITDVTAMIDILKDMGAVIRYVNRTTVEIDPRPIGLAGRRMNRPGILGALIICWARCWGVAVMRLWRCRAAAIWAFARLIQHLKGLSRLVRRIRLRTVWWTYGQRS